MGGRLRLSRDARELEIELGASWLGAGGRRDMVWNSGPGQRFPVLRAGLRPADRYIDVMQWGVVLARMNNTIVISATLDCAEVVPDAPARAHPWPAARRCLVPVDPFAEPGSGMEPPDPTPADDGLMTLGALWRQTSNAIGDVLACFRILVADAEKAKAQSGLRPPAIIPPEARSAWLDEDAVGADSAMRLLQPCCSGGLAIGAGPLRHRNARQTALAERELAH